MFPLTTHRPTHTHEHHSVLAFGWNYRSDFSLVEMLEDDSGRLNQGAMNQCRIKPLPLCINCQHRNGTHIHAIGKHLLSTVEHSNRVTTCVLTAERDSCQDTRSLPVHNLSLCSVILPVRGRRNVQALVCLIQQPHNKPCHHIDL